MEKWTIELTEDEADLVNWVFAVKKFKPSAIDLFDDFEDYQGELLQILEKARERNTMTIVKEA
ncbi:hypothetical protein ACRYI5_05765 [Furfurilactobacillus sp. WILCCON 0119]|uniref:hypothetical protein n=1 Tax=Furfurilactobacillus entadae TaxID=2922307 RepID=UPI0035EE5A55